MNSTGFPNIDPQEKNEQGHEKINLKEKIRELIAGLTYEERQHFENAPWEDPDRDWKETDIRWEEGLREYIEQKVEKKGGFDVSIFNQYLVKLQRRYDNTPYGDEEGKKKFYKGQLTVGKKLLGIFSPEKEKTGNKEKMKGIWSWENIKFTMRNVRRQIFELFGKKDPWFDYSQLQKGMSEIEQGASPAVPPKPAAAPPPNAAETPEERKAA